MFSVFRLVPQCFSQILHLFRLSLQRFFNMPSLTLSCLKLFPQAHELVCAISSITSYCLASSCSRHLFHLKSAIFSKYLSLFNFFLPYILHIYANSLSSFFHYFSLLSPSLPMFFAVCSTVSLPALEFVPASLRSFRLFTSSALVLTCFCLLILLFAQPVPSQHATDLCRHSPPRFSRLPDLMA